MRTPIDRIFKNTAEIDSRGFLHLFGSLDIGEQAEVREVGREIGLEAVHLDHLYEVKTKSWQGCYHFEFQTRYNVNLPQRISDYNQHVYLRYRLPVYSTLLLLVQKYAPAQVPEHFHIEAGGLAIRCDYRIIRLWEMDPEPIFRLDRPALLSLVPLMRSEPRDWDRAARAIISSGNRNLASSFMSLGSLRYDPIELEGVLDRMTLEEFIKPEWIRESKVRELKIMQPFVEECRAEGRAEGYRDALRRIFARRFPGLALPAGLDNIDDPAILESLVDHLADGASPVELQTIVDRAQRE